MDARELPRYLQLVERAAFDLRMAFDLAVSADMPPAHRARLTRSLRELRDERREIESLKKREAQTDDLTSAGRKARQP
jgi:hypothetical protein